MRFHTALLALVASPSCLAAGVVDDASSLAVQVSPIEDDSTKTTMTTTTMAGQATSGEYIDISVASKSSIKPR